MNHTSNSTALIYARQRGIAVPKAVRIPEDTDLTVGELLANAKAAGIPGVNTKTRKPALVAALNASAVVAPSVDLAKLTAPQRRRLRKKGVLAA